MTILLTGGAGFIGSHFAQAILKTGKDDLVIIDNLNDFYDPDIKRSHIQLLAQYPGMTFIQGDIRNLETLDKIWQTHQITDVVHLAAMAGVRPSIESPLYYEDVNIKGTMNILEMARKYQVRKLLFASSSSVYGNNEKVPFSETDRVDHPVSPYAATKKAGELLCYNYHHLYQIPIACLRFFTVYGPRQRPEMAIHKFTRMIDQGLPIPVFNQGNCQRDYTYIDDIIQGMMGIYHSEFGYEILNLGESHTIRTIDLIKLIEKALGKSAKMDLKPAQAGDVEITYADIQKAKSQFHYQPKTLIQEGVPLFVEWYLKNQAVLGSTNH